MNTAALVLALALVLAPGIQSWRLSKDIVKEEASFVALPGVIDVAPETRPIVRPIEIQPIEVESIPETIDVGDPGFVVLPSDNLPGSDAIITLPGSVDDKPSFVVLPGSIDDQPGVPDGEQEIGVLPGEVDGLPETDEDTINTLPGNPEDVEHDVVGIPGQGPSAPGADDINTLPGNPDDVNHDIVGIPGQAPGVPGTDGIETLPIEIEAPPAPAQPEEPQQPEAEQPVEEPVEEVPEEQPEQQPEPVPEPEPEVPEQQPEPVPEPEPEVPEQQPEPEPEVPEEPENQPEPVPEQPEEEEDDEDFSSPQCRAALLSIVSTILEQLRENSDNKNTITF